MEGDQVIEQKDGFGYDISNDGHYAKLTANMDAIINDRHSLTAKVIYNVQYYYKDGDGWKEGRLDENMDRWFNIDLGNDSRTVKEYKDLDGDWVGEGYDSKTHSFEYDGTKKTLLYELKDEGLSELVDFHYEDNEETEINEDADKYETYLSFTVKDEYKAQYKILPRNFRFLANWTIVTPKAVKEIIESVEKDITSKPADMTSEDEEAAEAVAEAKEKYDKLNDAQKKLISELY